MYTGTYGHIPVYVYRYMHRIPHTQYILCGPAARVPCTQSTSQSTCRCCSTCGQNKLPWGPARCALATSSQRPQHRQLCLRILPHPSTVSPRSVLYNNCMITTPYLDNKSKYESFVSSHECAFALFCHYFCAVVACVWGGARRCRGLEKKGVVPLVCA